MHALKQNPFLSHNNVSMKGKPPMMLYTSCFSENDTHCDRTRATQMTKWVNCDYLGFSVALCV